MGSPPRGSSFISTASRSPEVTGAIQVTRQPLPPVEPEHADPDPDGWNLIGMIDSKSGLGNASRTNIRALKELVGSRRVISFPSAHYPNPADLPAIHGRNYLHFNPCSRPIADLAPLPWFKGGRNIGFWAWETTQAPASWLKYDSFMEQIWVPSNFVADALLATGFKSPIAVIPHAIEPQPRHVFPERDKPITFLIQFDGHSRAERKRPDLSLKAITNAALRSNENVHVIIKCHHSDGANLVLVEHAKVKVELKSKWLQPEEMEAIWRRTDIFVSLNRGEGFGLPMVEAMARGIAVVATGWGGSADYMTRANSFPITAERLEPAVKSGDAYFKTGMWAMPCMEQAVKEISHAMKLIRLGRIHDMMEQARQTAAAFSFEAMKQKMAEALQITVP